MTRGCYQDGHTRDEPESFESYHPLHGRLYHCPRSAQIAMSGWFDDWGHYCKGFLPDAGGMNDQQAVFAQAIATLNAAEGALASMREKEREQK